MNTPRTDADKGSDGSRDCPRTKEVLLTGRLQGQSEICQLWRVTDLAYLLERELSAKSAEYDALRASCQRLRDALERIANSEPRPKRNRDYDASDIQSLQRTARAALQGVQP